MLKAGYHISTQQWSKAGRYFALLLCLWLYSMTALARERQLSTALTDSLQGLLLKIDNDTNRVRILSQLAWQFRTSNLHKALRFSQEAIDLAKELQFYAGWAQAGNYRSIIQRNIGDYSAAMTTLYEVRHIAEQHNIVRELAYAYNNIGDILRLQENYTGALEHITQAQALFEQLHDKVGVAYCDVRLGEVYQAQGEIAKALEEYQHSLRLREEVRDTSQILASKVRIAQIYQTQGKSVEMLLLLDTIARMNERRNDLLLASETAVTIAQGLLDAGEYSRAIFFAEPALQQLRRADAKQHIERAAIVLHRAYAAMGEFAAAYQYQMLAAEIEAQLRNQEVQRNMTNALIKYELDKQQLQFEQEQSRRRIIVYASVAISFLLLSFVIVVLFYAQKQKRVNQTLHQTNLEIIRQQSILESQARDIEMANEMLKEQNERLVVAKDQAEAANRAKSAFLATMSHEIRTPINVMLGFTDVLRDGIHSPEQLQYLQNITNAGTTLLRLFNDILDFSTLEAQQLMLERNIVDCRLICHELENTFLVQAQEKGLRFSAFCSSDLPRRIIVDVMRFRQILFHLVNNAIKFTERGEVTVHLHMEQMNPQPDQQGKITLHCIIHDTGIGIPAEWQEKMFDPFVQYDNKNTRRFGGIGLGLSVAKRLTEAMGGTIFMNSVPELGTDITVILPGVEVQEPETAYSDEQHIAHVESGHTASDFPESAQAELQRMPLSAELHQWLWHTMMPQWKKIMETMSNLDIEDFAHTLLDAAGKFSSEPLRLYAEELLHYSTTFKIVEMNKSFQAFEQIVPHPDASAYLNETENLQNGDNT